MIGRRRPAAAGLVAIGALALAGSARAQEPMVVPSEQADVLERADRARTRGHPEAPIRIVEISDFACRFCGQFFDESYRAVDSIYVASGTARYLWISFPNAAHPRAWSAIEAAFCAGSAGRFWPMHDVLFERREEWTVADDPNALFRDYADEIGIERESFAECLRNDQPAPLQVADYDSALRSGIASTPFFIVGDSVAIRGALPLDDFRSAVDSVLAARGIPIP